MANKKTELGVPFNVADLANLYKKASRGDGGTLRYLVVESMMAEVAASMFEKGQPFSQLQWDATLPMVEAFVDKATQ